MKLTDDSRVFVRASLVSMIKKARNEMKKNGYDLVIYDGWRSLVVQERLFWSYMMKYTVPKFNLLTKFEKLESSSDIKLVFESLDSELQEEMMKANLPYVSLPDKGPDAPSPHVTGGCIDVWLFINGQPIDLGVPFDYANEESAAFYHLSPNKSSSIVLSKEVKKRRSKLLLAMTNAGFSCYDAEFWHFNHGNQMDSVVTGKVPKYGCINID